MNRLLLLLGLAGLLLAAGCRKDDILDCAPAPTTNSALHGFAQRNGVPVQTFSILVGPNNAIQMVTTSAGARITFPASSFLLPNGTAATGPAQVRIREIYSVPDMVLSNMPTQLRSSRQLLISGGEFSIQVWQNGVRLRLASGPARVVVASPVPAGASAGQQSLWQQQATLVRDSAGWSPPPPSPAPGPNDTIRTVGAQPVYQTYIPLDSISWWNIDRLWSLYQNNSMGLVTVQVPAIPAGSAGSTQVFLRVVGLNGLARLYPTNAARTNWSTSLPIGASMKVAVIQYINNQIYFGTQSLTTQSGLTVTPTLTAMSETDAVRLIRQL